MSSSPSAVQDDHLLQHQVQPPPDGVRPPQERERHHGLRGHVRHQHVRQGGQPDGAQRDCLPCTRRRPPSSAATTRPSRCSSTWPSWRSTRRWSDSRPRNYARSSAGGKISHVFAISTWHLCQECGQSRVRGELAGGAGHGAGQRRPGRGQGHLGAAAGGHVPQQRGAPHHRQRGRALVLQHPAARHQGDAVRGRHPRRLLPAQPPAAGEVITQLSSL